MPWYGNAYPFERPNGEADMLGAAAALQLDLAHPLDMDDFRMVWCFAALHFLPFILERL
jgi:hypothetical protein